jgi:hypothetical protein
MINAVVIDRAMMQEFGLEAQKALDEVAQRFGIGVTLRQGVFAEHGKFAHYRLEMFVKEGATANIPANYQKEADDFKRYAFRYGLRPEHLGQVVKIDGKEVRIIGARPKKRKTPIIVSHNDRFYMMPAHAVHLALLANQQKSHVTVGDLSDEERKTIGFPTRAEVASAIKEIQESKVENLSQGNQSPQDG